MNAPDVEGTTALQWAAHWNDLDTVKALLAAGAKAERGQPLRRDAAARGRTIGSAPIVNALLRAGATADAAYGEGETPLMLAARSGNVDAVKLLARGWRERERRREIPRPDGVDAGGGREPCRRSFRR